VRSLGLAARAVVRQPARSALAILGVAAAGALLFDMLLLSHGLVVSFRELLDAAGFDVRVTATTAPPFAGPAVLDAERRVRAIEALAEVQAVVPLRMARAFVDRREGRTEEATVEIVLLGTSTGTYRRYWRLAQGEATFGPGQLVVNAKLAEELSLAPGDRLRLSGHCHEGALPPPAVELEVTGVVRFPFDSSLDRTAALGLDDLARVCGASSTDAVDLLLVASASGSGSDAAAAAIRAVEPGLHVFTNRELIQRFSAQDFSYFRQISFVLATITVFFAFLLVTSLLTVSVNQRFGEIAALRAIGFTRARVAAELFWQSVVLVGAGGLIALPVGAAVAVWLDRILKDMPGIPEQVHFFAFEPRALLLHGALIGATAVLGAVYPVWLAARLPIAATLRREVVS
jgi:putative ABC transport system permease protein